MKFGSKRKKLAHYFTEEEYTILLEATSSIHHKIAFMIAWESGLRISEVIDLKPEDIDVQHKTIKVVDGKGGKDRIVPLPRNWQEHHMNYIPMPCTGRALQKSIEEQCTKSGLMKKKQLHFHSLRHGFATHCMNKEMKLTNIQKLMGHSDISTTMIYTHMNPKRALDDYHAKVGE